MTDATQGAISERLRRLSAELRECDAALKTGATPELASLQEYRQLLDNARMTAWTVNELLNAAESQKDPAKVLSFVAAERLRRSNQMLKELSADIQGQGATWQTSGIQGFYETVSALQHQLSRLINEHRGHLRKAADHGR